MKHNELFLNSFFNHYDKALLKEHDLLILNEIAHHHLDDLTANIGGSFSHPTQEEITMMAASKLAHSLNEQTENIRKIWQQIAEDFHYHHFWGFTPEFLVTRKNIPPSPVKEIIPYIIILFSTMLLIKTFILFFGLHSASHPSQKDTSYLLIAIIVLFLSLGSFAWYFSKKK